MSVLASLIAILTAAVAALPALKIEAPAKAADAKVTYAQAAQTARARLPDAQVVEAELEVEHGKLVYSFDLRTEGKAGIDEVQVDAKDGRVVSVEHEGPQDEAREKREDAAKPSKR